MSPTPAAPPQTEELESLESFRARARSWIVANLPLRGLPVPREEGNARARALQAVIFDAGFAGIAYPKEYGGQGLTFDHQKVFAEESAGYEMPSALTVSIGMLGPTLLDHGSEELKRKHLPAILRGDEVWIQLLSEPSGGSDMAAAMTKASRDGDSWVINGAKMWSTGAAWADYGMCLARTNWDAPKHKGLSMFAVPMHAKGLTIEPTIANVGGPAHFFQEYLDDVAIPLGNLIGDENEGWSVSHALLFHERNATAGVAHGLGYRSSSEADTAGGGGVDDLIGFATRSGTVVNAAARQHIAEAYIASVVAAQAGDRVMKGMKAGAFKGDWGSVLKLGMGIDTPRRGEIGVILAGTDGVIWNDDDRSESGDAWLGSRTICIAGGTNEMQRNIVSERLLGMPREPASDKDIAFSDVVARRRKG